MMGRFFGFHPARKVNLVPWLAHWIRNKAVPVATMNMQRGMAEGEEIPDAWHHQLIFGVAPNAVFMTNPLDMGMSTDTRVLKPVLKQSHWMLLKVSLCLVLRVFSRSSP